MLDDSISSKKDNIIGLSCAGISFILYAPFVFIGVDFLHHGALLATAYALNRGAMLYRDVFSLYGAFTAYIHLFAFKVFGESLFSLQLVTLFFYPVISYFLYKTARLFLSVMKSIIILFLWIFSSYVFFWGALPWSSVYSLCFSMIAAYTLLRAFQNKERLFFTSGIFSAFVLWSRQNSGLFFSLGVIIFFIILIIFSKTADKRTYIKYFLFVISGFIIPSLIFLGYLYINNALFAMWQQNFIFALYWGKNFGGRFQILHVLKILLAGDLVMTLRSLILFISVEILVLISISRKKILFSLIFISAVCAILTSAIETDSTLKYLIPAIGDPVLPFVLVLANMTGVVLVLYNWIKSKYLLIKKQHIYLMLLSILSLASWMQFYPLNDPLHVYYSIPLMLILLGIILRQTLEVAIPTIVVDPKHKKVLVNIGFLLFALVIWLPGANPRIYAGIKKLLSIRHLRFIQNPPILRGILETPEKATAIEHLAQQISEISKKSPQINLYVLGLQPITLTFIPNNRFPQFYQNQGEFANQVFKNFKEVQYDEIRKTKPIVVLTFPDYEMITTISQQLKYKVVYNDKLIDHAVLIPE